MQKRVVAKFGGSIGAMGLLLASCVTINIYFPAAAAEKAADKIIDEVWQLKQEAKPATPPTETTGVAK